MTFRSVVFLLLLAALALAHPAHAAQSTAACTGTISSFPATISTPGTWCLAQGNLKVPAGTAPAITIAANDVTLDCNDFWITGTQAQKGIYATNQFDVTVRRCVLNQFGYGIELVANPGAGGRYVVEDNTVSVSGGDSIYVAGDGSVVRHNLVNGGLATGGGTLATGIYTDGSIDILGNTVTAITKSGSGSNVYGIYSVRNLTGSIAGNSIGNLQPQMQGFVHGIRALQTDRISIRDNTLIGNGTAGGIGIMCPNTKARVFHNVIAGFTTGMQFCGDAGDNDISP